MLQDLYNPSGKLTGVFASIGDQSPQAFALQQQRMASIADWNRRAASPQEAQMQGQAQAQVAPDQTPAYQQQAVQALTREYEPKTPSWAMAGNEVLDNGSWRTLQPGEDPNKLREAAQQAAQTQYVNRLKGNLAAGTKDRKLLADPRFHRLSPEEQQHIYQHVYGSTLDEDLFADQLGGSNTVADVRAQMQLPQKQKAAKDWLGTFEQANGVNPGEAFQQLRNDMSSSGSDGKPVTQKIGYDPQAEIAYVPGKTVQVRDELGGTHFEPARQLQIPLPMYQQYQRQQAALAGYATPEKMQAVDPRALREKRWRELETKNAEFNRPKDLKTIGEEARAAAQMRQYLGTLK